MTILQDNHATNQRLYNRAGDLARTEEEATALRWAGWGQRIFPIQPRGKTPLTAQGFHDATSDPAIIREWWAQWPTANIGLSLAAEVVVLDYDTPSEHHATEHDGMETWEQMYRGHDLPPTLRVTTGGGGMHEFYRLPYDDPIRSKAGPGVDTRKGGKGYVVAAGSTHPSGNPYTVIEWHDPRDLPVLPRYLERFVYKPLMKPVEPIAPANYGKGTGAGLLRTVAEAPQGERNKLLFWAACQAYRDGLDLNVQLTDAARTAGLGDTEIDNTLKSAARTAGGNAA